MPNPLPPIPNPQSEIPNPLMIRTERLHKSYPMGRTKLHVLRGVGLEVKKGEFLAVVGASGSGKSTLLHLMGLLDEADSGTVILDGQDVTALSSARRARVRRADIGFVFQFYHLLPELNVLENVLIARMTGTSIRRWLSGAGRAARESCRALLGELGLGERLKHRPSELSGGERQRVAIARGLVNSPKVLLADEPTGNLDSRTGKEILAVLQRFNAERGQTVVMVTHDQSLAEQAHRVVRLKDGRLA